MATFEIKEATRDYVYLVITLDNGASFGQVVRDIEADTRAEALAEVKAQVKALLRQRRNRADLRLLQADVGKQIDPDA